MLRTAILLLVAFGIGGCVGTNMQPSPEVEFIKVPKTEIIYRESETPTPSTPTAEFTDNCKYALRYANEAVRYAEKIYNSGEGQLAIVSDARLALADSSDLAGVENAQRALLGATVGALANMEEALSMYEITIQKCNKGE